MALRWRVIFKLREGWNFSDTAKALHVGKTFVKKVWKLFSDNQTVEYPPRPKKLRSLTGKQEYFRLSYPSFAKEKIIYTCYVSQTEFDSLGLVSNLYLLSDNLKSDNSKSH